jgi:hypothetical protein
MNQQQYRQKDPSNQGGRARPVPPPAEQPQAEPGGHLTIDGHPDPYGTITTLELSSAGFAQPRRTGRRDEQSKAKRSHRPRHRRAT